MTVEAFGYGNFFPAEISFPLSMRDYTGNWPVSVWLFRGDSSSTFAVAKMQQMQPWPAQP